VADGSIGSGNVDTPCSATTSGAPVSAGAVVAEEVEVDVEVVLTSAVVAEVPLGSSSPLHAAATPASTTEATMRRARGCT
jgi:hypothetical protein